MLRPAVSRRWWQEYGAEEGEVLQLGEAYREVLLFGLLQVSGNKSWGDKDAR